MCGIREIVFVFGSDVIASNQSLYSIELFTHLKINLRFIICPSNVSRDTFVFHSDSSGYELYTSFYEMELKRKTMETEDLMKLI